MNTLLRRYGWPLTAVIVLLCAWWVVVMVVLPQLVMVDYSFRPNLLPRDIGTEKDVWTLANYKTLWSNQIHLAIFFKTIWASCLVTFVTFVVCYPIAYYMAQVARGPKAGLFAVLLVIPYWVNEILRTFAWYILLSRGGPINEALMGLGLIAEPIDLKQGDLGVILGMVYAYILFMVFPLYTAMESLDRNQIEAARDLGASIPRIHWRVVIPHSKPGIATGCIMTFMLAAGSYAVPALLGSPGSRWFTEIIYNWFFEGGDWPQGSAYAFILLLLCLGFILLMLKLFKVRLGDIAK